LNGQVVPSTQHDLPVALNFFLAAKGPDGSLTVAGGQASYDGALRAMGIHSLQNYGKDEPLYDNKAHTRTSIYHGGTLKMFTSHPSQPADSEDQPGYYMTQLNGWSMTANPETFRQGATWYRNSRDWAKEQRDEAIRRANEQVNREVESQTLMVNASFSTVGDTSGDETSTIESASQQSRFSFNNNNIYLTESFQESDTSNDALQLTSCRSVRSSSTQTLGKPQRSRRKVRTVKP
jgi:hypothetical protein